MSPSLRVSSWLHLQRCRHHRTGSGGWGRSVNANRTGKLQQGTATPGEGQRTGGGPAPVGMWKEDTWWEPVLLLLKSLRAPIVPLCHLKPPTPPPPRLARGLPRAFVLAAPSAWTAFPLHPPQLPPSSSSSCSSKGSAALNEFPRAVPAPKAVSSLTLAEAGSLMCLTGLESGCGQGWLLLGPWPWSGLLHFPALAPSHLQSCPPRSHL